MFVTSSSCEKDACCSCSLQVSRCSQIPQVAWISPVSNLHISAITIFKSCEKNCMDGQRCFGFDVTLANWKAFPKLRMVKCDAEWCWRVPLCWSALTDLWLLLGVASRGANCLECTVPLFCILVGKLEIGCSPGLQVGSCWCGISHAQVQHVTRTRAGPELGNWSWAQSVSWGKFSKHPLDACGSRCTKILLQLWKSSLKAICLFLLALMITLMWLITMLVSRNVINCLLTFQHRMFIKDLNSAASEDWIK